MRILFVLIFLFPMHAFAKAQLTITDGAKIYHQETFSRRAAADKWLADERTRPYWRESFVVTLTDNDAIEDAAMAARLAADKAEQDAIENKRRTRMERLKAIDWSTAKTANQLRDILKDIVVEIYGE